MGRIFYLGKIINFVVYSRWNLVFQKFIDSRRWNTKRKGKHIEYYQVTLQLPQNSTRETDNLRFIPDGFKKTVLSLNADDEGIIDGIEVKYVLDWLLKK